MIARLCKYLVQQGYDPSEITVLAAYAGQFFELRQCFDNILPKGYLRNVELRVLDKVRIGILCLSSREGDTII